MVPGAGLEPARYYYRGILSPLCLPIPPPGQNAKLLMFIFLTKYKLTNVNICNLPKKIYRSYLILCSMKLFKTTLQV